MWYGSNIAWGAVKEDMRHLIKYAESDDGIHWSRNNAVAIDFSGPDEYAMCKPCVIKDGDCYKMWFCSRGKAYRIYYAESDDGITWRRQTEPASTCPTPAGIRRWSSIRLCSTTTGDDTCCMPAMALDERDLAWLSEIGDALIDPS